MLLTIFCPVVRSQEHLAPIMSFHLSLFKMVGLHYMPFFACHDYKDNTSSAAGLKIYRIQLSGDELRLDKQRSFTQAKSTARDQCSNPFRGTMAAASANGRGFPVIILTQPFAVGGGILQVVPEQFCPAPRPHASQVEV